MSLGIVITLSLVGGSVEAKAAGCEAIGNIHFICDQLGPEDFAVVPGAEWVLVVWYGGERRHPPHRPARQEHDRAFPERGVYGAAEQENIWLVSWADLDLKATSSEPTAYICALDRTQSIPCTSFIMATGNRSKFSNWMLGPSPPTLTWIGCAVAPDPIGLNSVVGLSDGGFITTNFLPRGGDAAARERMMAGEINGEVWEWHPNTGWKKVPGSEAAGPNGLEVSKDGKWLYIGGWGSQTFIRLSRGQTPIKKDSVSVGFRLDNLRWAPDGTLLAAGQGGTAPSQTSNVMKVNPTTLKVQELVRHPPYRRLRRLYCRHSGR